MPSLVKSYGVSPTVNGLLNMNSSALGALLLLWVPGKLKRERVVLRAMLYPWFWSIPPRFFSGGRAAASVAATNPYAADSGDAGRSGMHAPPKHSATNRSETVGEKRLEPSQRARLDGANGCYAVCWSKSNKGPPWVDVLGRVSRVFPSKSSRCVHEGCHGLDWHRTCLWISERS